MVNFELYALDMHKPIYDDNSLHSNISELEDQMDACVAVKLNRIMIDSMVDRFIRVSTGRFDQGIGCKKTSQPGLWRISV